MGQWCKIWTTHEAQMGGNCRWKKYRWVNAVWPILKWVTMTSSPRLKLIFHEFFIFRFIDFILLGEEFVINSFENRNIGWTLSDFFTPKRGLREFVLGRKGELPYKNGPPFRFRESVIWQDPANSICNGGKYLHYTSSEL